MLAALHIPAYLIEPSEQLQGQIREWNDCVICTQSWGWNLICWLQNLSPEPLQGLPPGRGSSLGTRASHVPPPHPRCGVGADEVTDEWVNWSKWTEGSGAQWETHQLIFLILALALCFWIGGRVQKLEMPPGMWSGDFALTWVCEK